MVNSHDWVCSVFIRERDSACLYIKLRGVWRQKRSYYVYRIRTQMHLKTVSLLCIFFKVVLSRLWRSPTGFRRGFSVLLRHNTPDRSLEQSCFAVCLLEINNKKLRCIVSPWRFITWRKVDLFCCGVFIFKSTDPLPLFSKVQVNFQLPKDEWLPTVRFFFYLFFFMDGPSCFPSFC